MTVGLTKRQRQAFDFIATYICEKGYGPSYAEIMRGLGLHSKSGIHRIVHALNERGFINEMPNRSRSISLNELKRFSMSRCPYCDGIIGIENVEKV